ncbi:MAG: co-chaperone GroES [Bdellovibrionales bacterium]|nr:co-chaperone GroES [Bdellovibrionales bacterium]
MAGKEKRPAGERAMFEQRAGRDLGPVRRRISPLGMRVLLRIRKESDQTDSGLYLPEGAKEAKFESLLGEVLEVARAVDDDTHEEANISGIPQGELVLIPKAAGIRVPWDDELRLVETSEILAIVHEVSVV